MHVVKNVLMLIIVKCTLKMGDTVIRCMNGEELNAKKLIKSIMTDHKLKSYRSFAHKFDLPLDSVNNITSRNIKAGATWIRLLEVIKEYPDMYLELIKKEKPD